MITQWDIISSIRPKDNAILYALLIDGTEHDARLIAKKLQGYVRAPQPALAPYVYRFALPEDLDEDTLEKIRVAVREGIEQAKKVNEFMPGGALGNPLFSADTDKEDKDFPTFITLDPSESFFRSAQDSRPLPPPPPPNVENFEQKSISANETEEEIPQIAKTLEEIDNAGYRSDPAETPTPPAKPQKADETGGAPADITQSDTDAVLTEDVLTSIESEEPWPDELSSSAQTSAAALAAEETEPMTDSKVSQPKDELDIQVQAVTSEDLPDNLVPQPHTQPLLTPEISQTQQADLPISDRDMLIKDMEGTTLGQSLDDILLAETKYDMFVDLDKLSAAPKKEAEKTPLIKEAPASAEDAPNDSFNIFDQKIKDQTSFIDLNDVQNITERITQKDLSFLRHTQVPGKQQPPDAPAPAAQDTPAETGLDKTRAYMPLPPAFGRFEAVQEEQEEVMDPFEQMLAASKNKEQTPPAPPAPLQVETPAEAEADAKAEDDTRINEKTEPEKSVTETPAETTHSLTSSTVPQPPVLTEQKTEEPLLTPPQIPDDTQNLSAAADPVSLPPELPTEQIRVCRTETDAEESPADTPADLERHTERENRVVPPPMPSMENTMSENQGDKKPILRIKRKAQPQAPAAPQTPKPLPPSAPAPQIAPAAPQTQPSAPAPQEEKHGTTILRRRPANTFLEKTRTIDHSIELPLSELKKHNWPLEVPLVPTFTLENMTISVNRFAHATAISVIDNPGKLYNPLVLHGASGTGKTHFLHAIGYALSNKYGQENIFITNGVRLSRGIQRYVMEGNIEKFENFISSVKALLIDDIHLIAINEQNRAYLSKLLNDFRTQQKQIVITSKYPPESLAKLEELLNFRLSSGWISELKPASGSARTRIIQKMLNSNGIDITNEDINRFFGKANMSLGTVSRSIRRVRVLEKLIFPQENQEKRSASAIFDQLLATSGEDSSSLIAQKVPAEVNSAPVTGNGEWGRVGFFYPQNHSNMMNWLVFALQQRAKELGISGGPELAVRSSYSTENIISSAFKIANLCDNKKLKAAVILGPETENCEPSVRENFYDILTHMLEVMLIRCGVINYEDVGAPSTYVKILSELLR